MWIKDFLHKLNYLHLVNMCRFVILYICMYAFVYLHTYVFVELQVYAEIYFEEASFTKFLIILSHFMIKM